MSTRKDTDFWKKFTYENASKKLKEKLDILEYRFLKYEDVKDEIWGLESWLFVAYGIGLIKKELYDLYSQYSKSYNKKLKIENDIKLMQDDIRQMCLYHKDFLNLF